MKNVIVFGASTNPERYAYKASVEFKAKGYNVFPVGRKRGLIQDMEILEEPPMDRHIDVVSIYLGKDNQQLYYDYLLKIKPDHVIFNPGTENPELEQMLTEKGIRNEEACSLVLMRIGEL